MIDLRPLLALGLALPMVACGPSPSTTDAGPVPDAPIGGDSGVTVDARVRPDAGPTNDSFEGAEAITTDGTAVTDAIEAPEDVDFWTFEGTAGEWIAINTTANEMDDPMMVDTVITLYDSSRTQIAENDDGVPRANTDSEIVIRLPSTGTYYVEVQEFSAWNTEDDIEPEGRGAYTYSLAILELTAGGAIQIDAEPGDDAASAAPLTFGGMSSNIAFVLGALDDATDVDVFSFTMPAAVGGLLGVDVMPGGIEGYGSTRLPARIWVTNAAGTDVIARIEPRGMQQADLSPALVAGTPYLLWVDAGGGSAGTNDHYVLKALVGADNPAEPTASNDVYTAASPITTAENEGILRGFVLATLPTTDDVDFFSFDVPAGRQINVFCGSQSSGSGLRGVSARLFGSDGTTMLGMSTETATEGVAITAITPPAAGTYYFRVGATSTAPDVSSRFVRCGVALVTPAAP
jgi:hypothetical protein